jgi:hypothetical protein
MLTLRRVLIGLVVALAVLLAAVAVSVPVDRLLTRDRLEAVANATVPGA